ncbi:hypothetical protein HYX07_02250 [Candidatus Woesearchaeota archaeon]|nr:hypothetical protein [Candidatus Woesearchaeota archaeon]
MAVIGETKKIEKDGLEVDRQTLERIWQLDSKSSPINSIQYLADRRVVWERYWNVLKSRALLFRFSKKWNAFAKALQLKYFLIEDIGRFENEKLKALKGSERVSGIEENNPRLAEALKKFSPVQENTIPSLGSLLAALSTNPEFARAYIQTHGTELISWINLLKEDNKLKDELRKLVIEISGAEIAEIDKCIADLEAWQSFRIGNGIQFFQNRVKMYMGGGKTGGRGFLGLGKFFKDWDLVKKIKTSKALRMLLFYQRQLLWFEKARKVVMYASWKPGWEGFRGPNGFYYNLAKGENYLDMIEHTFGNEKAARELKNAYPKAGEVPKLWLPYIDDILAKLRDSSYVNKEVILDAAADLTNILKKRRGELSTIDVNANLKKLAAALRRIFKEAVRKSENLRAFEELLQTELDFLKKELRAEKGEFTNALLDYGEPIFVFVEESASWIEKRDRTINSYIGAYVFLTKAKLQTLKRRIGRRINLFSFETDERIKIEEDKIREIQSLGMQEVRKQSREIEAMEATLKERMAQATMVDKVLKLAIPNYFTRNGVSISELGYL